MWSCDFWDGTSIISVRCENDNSILYMGSYDFQVASPGSFHIFKRKWRPSICELSRPTVFFNWRKILASCFAGGGVAEIANRNPCCRQAPQRCPAAPYSGFRGRPLLGQPAVGNGTGSAPWASWPLQLVCVPRQPDIPVIYYMHVRLNCAAAQAWRDALKRAGCRSCSGFRPA